ncbi:MAG: hypothetical protein ACRDK1_00265 [Solirubrobacterales bacterium]
MALAADQQAMLQLLLERGQSYADLGAVLGVDEAEVRSRARAALTELGGVDPDRNVGLTDYLLGQADPIDRADAVRHLKDDPDDLALATEVSQKLRLVAPQADLPRLPGEERRPRRAGQGAASRLPIPARLRSSTPAGDKPGGESASTAGAKGRRTRLVVALGCLAVLLVVGILAVTGAFKGDNSSDAATTTTSQRLATVPLSPPNRGKAAGLAAFGIANNSQLYVDVTLKGLPPAPSGQAYVMWLMLTGKQGYPVPSVLNISKSGSFQQRITIPDAEVPIAQRARSVDVSIAPVNAIQASIKSAFKNRRLVDKPGTTALSGAIPTGSGSGGQTTTTP